jgi:hypothetical protein
MRPEAADDRLMMWIFRKLIDSDCGKLGLDHDSTHLLEGHPVRLYDVVVCLVVEDVPVLPTPPVRHRDGLDESVVLVQGEDVKVGVTADVLVDHERSGLLEGALARVRVELLLVNLEEFHVK